MFARALRTWIVVFVVGAVCLAVGIAVIETTALLALAGFALVLAGALGAIATAVRHRHRP